MSGKKAVVFIGDPESDISWNQRLVEGVYAQDPDLDLTIVQYDNLDELYDVCENDPELKKCVPNILHPGN